MRKALVGQPLLHYRFDYFLLVLAKETLHGVNVMMFH